VRSNDQISFSENDLDLIEVAANKIPTNDMYVRSPVLRPNEPHICCEIGAPLNANEIKRLNTKAPIANRNTFGSEAIPDLNSPKRIPRQEIPMVARKINLIRFIGS